MLRLTVGLKAVKKPWIEIPNLNDPIAAVG